MTGTETNPALIPQHKWIVAAAPHVHSSESIPKVMRDVILALTPALLLGLYFFRFPALVVVLTAVISSVLAETVWQKILKKPVQVSDGSAVLTGLLLALTLPPTTPWWMVMIGGMVSILLGKQIFGGLGHNPFNPALIGRAFLQISWPQALNTWITPVDAISAATPLTITRLHLNQNVPSLLNLWLGNHAGSLGETSDLLLWIGGLFLIFRKQIFLITPLTYIVTVALMAFAFNQNVPFHMFSGGLALGAFFMATDPVTTPVTVRGKFLFALGCGILTVLIRLKGSFPEGVCFSILIMNMIVPYIDQISIPKPFGHKGKKN